MSEQTSPKTTDSNANQSVFISSLGITKNYPKTMLDSEIGYDAHVNLKGNSPEDYFLNKLPNENLQKAFQFLQQPIYSNKVNEKTQSPLTKDFNSYLENGQPAMKLLAVRPDVALGFSKDITPEQLAQTYKPWVDIWKESEFGKAPSGMYAQMGQKHPVMAFVPWFLSEFVPSELLSWGSKPINWAGAYGIEKLGPPVINAVLSKASPAVRKALLTDVFNSEKALADDFATLGLQSGTKTSDVVKAYRSASLDAHIDRGGSTEAMQAVNKAYENIMSARSGFQNKFFEFLRKLAETVVRPQPKLALTSQSGSADLVPGFQFNEGDLVKTADGVGKVLQMGGEIAIVNVAGKPVEMAVSKLKPYEPKTAPAILPKELQGAKPRYNVGQSSYAPQFASDVDKALFITSQKTKSKRDGDYRSFLNGQGFTDKEIDQYGQLIRTHIKSMAMKEAGGPTDAPTDLMVKNSGIKPVSKAVEADKGDVNPTPTEGKVGKKPFSLRSHIKNRWGGITPESLKAAGFSNQDLIEWGHLGLLNKKGGKFDDLAQTLINEGSVSAQEGEFPTDAVMAALKGDKTRVVQPEVSDAEWAAGEAGAGPAPEIKLKEEWGEEQAVIPPAIPPQEPPPVATSGAEPPEEVPQGASAVNLERLQVTQEGAATIKKATKEIADEIENQTGATLTHEEVVSKAKEAELLTGAASREQTEKFAAALLKTRQHLAALANEGTITPEFLDTLKVVANTGTDIARMLESFKIEAMPEFAATKIKIIRDLLKLGKSAEDIMEAAKGVDFKNPDQVADFYRKFVKPTLSEQLDEFAYINILSSPLTHIKNTASNLIQMLGVAPLTKLYTGALDAVGSALTGQARSHYMSEVPAYYKGILNAMPKAWENLQSVMAGKSFEERPDVAKIATKSKWVNYATLGLGKYVTRALEASDIFVRTMVQQGELNSLLERNQAPLTDKLMKEFEAEAARRAEYYVFRAPVDTKNKTGQGDLLSWMDKGTVAVYGLRKVPGAQWFLRFVRTPMNILKQGIEYSPLGITTIGGSKDKYEQAGKAMLGSTLFAGGLYMAMSGRTTWSLPRGKKERAMFYQAGMVPYSIKIGDKWYSYSKIGPLAYPVAMSAGLYYYTKEGPDATSDEVGDKVSKFLSGVMGFFSDQSYVQGMGDLVKALQGDATAQARSLANVPGQMVPLSALQRWVNGVIDPIFRKPATGVNIDSVIDHIKQSVIGLSQTLPAAKDLFGQDSKKDNQVFNALSPVSRKNSDSAGDMILKNYRTGQRQSRKVVKDAENIIKKIKK